MELGKLHPRMTRHVEEMKEQKKRKLDTIVTLSNEGKTIKEIAKAIDLAPTTVKKYRIELRKEGRL